MRRRERARKGGGEVRGRAGYKPGVRAPDSLVRRRLMLPSADRSALLHLMKVHIHTGAAQLIGSRLGERAYRLGIGRGKGSSANRAAPQNKISSIIRKAREEAGVPCDVES